SNMRRADLLNQLKFGETERWLRFFEQNFCVVKWKAPTEVGGGTGQLADPCCPRLGCHAEGQRGVVSLIGRAPVKRGGRRSAIVKFQITGDRSTRLRDALVELQIH